jgi:type I restriction enzyme S subunit
MQGVGGTTVRRFKPYPTYKDSGVEWLGEIPTHWTAKKVKRLCLVRRGASPRPIEDPSYFDEGGEYAWVRIADVTASERYLERTTQRLSALGKSKSVPLEPGELFVSIAATVGKPVITKIRCCIHDGFVYFVGLREDREYLFYLFCCGEPYKGLGKLGTQLNLNTDTIGDIHLPLPSGAEQRTIVRFLDRETARIDALIEKKEHLIELLQEKRTALITHAVTKGLDPNVPMKDSGVEWLGEIPAHWTALASRRLIDRIEQGWSPVAEDRLAGPDEWAVIKLSAVDKGRFRSDEHKALPADLAPDTRYEIREGDFLLTRANTPDLVGDVCVARDVPSKLMLCDLVYRLQLRKDGVDPTFAAYWFVSSVGRHQIEVDARGASQSMVKVSQGHIRSWTLVLPPDEEQRAIVAFLDPETARIDELVTKVRHAISHLKELRTALISAAVTGKIDVREETRA